MATTTKSDAGIYHSKVLDRAFGILGVIAEEGTEMAITDLSRRVKLHKSTTHRLIMVLESSRFLEKNELNGKYGLGSRVIELGLSALNRLDVYNVAKPRLGDLVEETLETAHLGVMKGMEIVSLCTVESSQTLRTPSTVGARHPAHCSSLGKAILAFGPPSQVDNFLRRQDLTSYTRRTITSPARFREELEKIRKHGFAMDNEEREDGLRCIGAPVRNGLDEVVAAVSIAGPAFRVTDERLPALASAVLRAAWRISSSLGYAARLPDTALAMMPPPATKSRAKRVIQ